MLSRAKYSIDILKSLAGRLEALTRSEQSGLVKNLPTHITIILKEVML